MSDYNYLVFFFLSYIVNITIFVVLSLSYIASVTIFVVFCVTSACCRQNSVKVT